LKDFSEIDVVGHRVVHGGAEFIHATPINDSVETAIARLAPLAPLHNPANLAGIRAARKLLPDIPHFAVFDTAFHRTLAESAYTYPGPYAWKESGIRRYGFHGTSFRWASEQAARLLQRQSDPELRLILCHLGGGCSLCATIGGRSVETTMGFTPLDGIAMCTRSGSVDPGSLIHLLRNGTDIDDLETDLNTRSGLKGLSGLSGDTRVILPEMEGGDQRAQLAWDVFIHRLRLGMAAMLGALDGWPDAFVFTDVIGESEPTLRAAACAPFSFFGLKLDTSKNKASRPDSDIATRESVVRALIVKSREACQIARECHAMMAQHSPAT
jgi:acetate kinase